jgi:lysylphosphatidylglycerol synthetase-like protein (DUF2156 family)
MCCIEYLISLFGFVVSLALIIALRNYSCLLKQNSNQTKKAKYYLILLLVNSLVVALLTYLSIVEYEADQILFHVLIMCNGVCFASVHIFCFVSTYSAGFLRMDQKDEVKLFKNILSIIVSCSILLTLFLLIPLMRLHK